MKYGLYALMISLVWASPVSSSLVLYTENYGVKCDGTSDDAPALQVAFNAASNNSLLIQRGSCVLTKALRVPPNVRIYGSGDGGAFATALRPINTSALEFDQVHHGTIAHLMVWPIVTQPISHIIGISGTYSVQLVDIRLHFDTLIVPSTGILFTHRIRTSNDIILNRVVIRSSQASLPSNIRFEKNFGSVSLLNVDVENAHQCLMWLGGNVQVNNLYTEQCGKHAIMLHALDDLKASFVMSSGVIHNPVTATGIGIYAGAKNVYIAGAYITPSTTGYQVYIYSNVQVERIYVRLANIGRIGKIEDLQIPLGVITIE